MDSNDLTGGTAAIISGGTAAVVSAIAWILINWVLKVESHKTDKVITKLEEIEKLIKESRPS